MNNFKLSLLFISLLFYKSLYQQSSVLTQIEKVLLIGKLAFKDYSKKQKNRQYFLIHNADTLKDYKDKMEYSDGGIRNGHYVRAFNFDSVTLNDNLVISFKKIDADDNGDVFLFNPEYTKKITKLIEYNDHYECVLQTGFWTNIAYKYTTKGLKKYQQSPTKTAENLNITNIYAKIFIGDKKNMPLTDSKVFLLSNNGDTIKKTTTNELGNFEFKNVNSENFNIYIPNTDKIQKEKEIYLANQNGKIVSTFKKLDKGFTYRLLPAEIVKLSEMEVEDPVLKINAFKNSTEKSITITENIYYPKNEFIVTPEIAIVLNVIVINLNENKSYKLDILSHTDAIDDDNSNLELSKKRANAALEYLVSKGIDKNRLKAIGLGETKILNRCINNIICSEKEHEINRRTEFKYTK